MTCIGSSRMRSMWAQSHHRTWQHQHGTFLYGMSSCKREWKLFQSLCSTARGLFPFEASKPCSSSMWFGTHGHWLCSHFITGSSAMGVLLVNLKAKKMHSAISLGLHRGPGLCLQAQADRQTHAEVFGGKTSKLQQSRSAGRVLASTLEIIS